MSQEAILAEKDIIVKALKLASSDPATRGARFGVLLRQVDPSFTVSDHGYVSLRAFLEAHADLVELGHDGSDIVVRPSPATSELRQIRNDFWSAFAWVNDTVNRYYDPSADEALIDRGSGKTRLATLDTGTLIKIVAVTEEQHRQAAERICAVQSGSVAEQLRSALDRQDWFQPFMRCVRNDTQLQKEWHRCRYELVLSRIRDWATSNNLVNINPFTRRVLALPTTEISAVSERRVANDAPSRINVTPSPSSSEWVQKDTDKQILLRALSMMPLAQILALRIPPEYVLRAARNSDSE